MPLFERVLAPTDFSPASERAVRFARDLAAGVGAELHILHVVEDIPSLGVDDAVFLQEVESRRRQTTSARLDSLTNALHTNGLDILPATRHGHPFVEICRYVEAECVDLIITGTHGASGIAHMLIGSVAENVARRAPCAVLTVPADDRSQRISQETHRHLTTP
ncbi:MAG: universal stress protein [Planctomycetota bacterium]|jgi:nucleotide-binding universal stress UspA family protein